MGIVMAKKRGNPNWVSNNIHAFKTDRPESRMGILQVRIEPSLLEEIKQIPDWADLVRNSVAEIVRQTTGDIPDHLKSVY
jgi:hypothetical protein